MPYVQHGEQAAPMLSLTLLISYVLIDTLAGNQYSQNYFSLQP